VKAKASVCFGRNDKLAAMLMAGQSWIKTVGAKEFSSRLFLD
jgi:hypothetical protein